MLVRNRLVVALLSASLLSLELAWTRIFSAEFFYTFAFLILSMAVLGLGLGALSLRLVPPLGRLQRPGWLLVIGAATALAGPPLVFELGLEFEQLVSDSGMIGKLVAAILILNTPYLFGGAALALLFRRHHRDMPRLYMADLVGAGVGVGLIILAMNRFGTPAALYLLPIPMLIAAVLAGGKLARVGAGALVAGCIVLANVGTGWLAAPRQERGPVGYVHWDAAAKVKIYEFSEDRYGLEVDNAANSPVYRFDGNWDKPDSLLFQFGIGVEWLLEKMPDFTFLSLGAGGGTDVLQALQYGAAEVHAVEVVPHVNWLMTEGRLAEFTGHIYDDPRVTVATEDVRAYVRRFENKFDCIYSLSSNSFAALASGGFALAESYLFTTEAFGDYWRALTDRGFLSMEHQFYMPRLVSEVMVALEKEGVAEPTDHFAVYNLPSMRRKLLLLSKQPLTDEIRQNAYAPLSPDIAEHIHLLYPPGPEHADNLYDKIVRLGWASQQDSIPIDLSPCPDNRPFTAQLGLWKNFEWEKPERLLPYEFVGFPLAKLIVVIILVAVLLLVLPLNLLPALGRGPRLGPVPWLYFFTIGLAFMAVEVVLIQKYALFIGPSIWSLTTIMVGLLVATGIGSFFAERVPAAIAFGGIVLWLGLDALLFPFWTGVLGGLTLVPRMLVTVLALAPLGFCLGIPFPRAALRVGPLVDWGFAVNGAASVIGSTGILLIAFTRGFRVSLLLAAAVYLLAWGLYSRRGAWRSSQAHAVGDRAAPEAKPAEAPTAEPVA